MYIKTERLELKPFSAADEARAVLLLTNAVVKQTYMLPDFAEPQDAVPLFQRLMALSLEDGRYVAGIYLDGLLIGILNETEVCDRSIEVGYALLPDYYNQGYATEALQGAAGFLLDQGFARVIAGAFEENAASIRVMVKAGFSLLDKADTIEYRGRTHRCVYYGLQNPIHYGRL